MPMDEDAMFKALLKNKPQPKQPPQAPAAKEFKEPVPPAPRQPSFTSKGSEDAMYKALLHNRPQAQVSKPQARVEPAPVPVQQAPVYHEPAAAPVVQAPEVDLTPVVDSIKNLTASVNQVSGLLKTILAVLILILLVGLAILIKT